MSIDRNQVTEPDNFVWIPTGHYFGEPSGIVGYWEGDVKDDCPIIDFPEGKARLSSRYVKMYEPTEAEIKRTINDSDRWRERDELEK